MSETRPPPRMAASSHGQLNLIDALVRIPLDLVLPNADNDPPQRSELAREYDPPVPYRYLGLRVLPTLGTTWKTCTINFRTEDNMPNYPDVPLKLAFIVGHALGTVWIDDIQLDASP